MREGGSGAAKFGTGSKECSGAEQVAERTVSTGGNGGYGARTRK